ncbi:dipeptidase [candidate division KSB1 bacterium]|nr:dipeptidase [candidate division KSB1 bacterium]
MTETKKSLLKRWFLIVAGLTLVIVAIVVTFLPARVARRLNAVHVRPPYRVTETVQLLHDSLFIADLHADALLWNRDLLTRSTNGHVDVPRLLAGNVAVQAFTVVTKTPRNLNIERNTGDSDDITLLAMAQRWPVATWTSLKERALFQARKLHEIAGRSDGKLVLIKTSSDLQNYMAARRESTDMTAGFLGMEGAHPLEGDLNNLDIFFEAGYRMIGLTHFFDNEVGGSAHGVEKGGLSAFGTLAVKRMEELHILVDLAHASPRLIDEVLAIATRPLVVSHSGGRGQCDNQRNLSDEHLRGIAQTGGVIGIGFWETAVCGVDAAAIAAAIRYAVNVAGIDHVGLGSDFDGAVTTPFDASGMALLTAALLEEGFGREEIHKIMGGNVQRLLLQTLP